MARNDAQDAKLRDAKRRAAWTIPLEYYYRSEAPAAPSQGAAGLAQASPSTVPRYTVEPVAGGCAVIRPRFGSEPGVKLRRKGGV